jgi:ribA/ribD-fused uncharacterized protein
MSNTDHLFFGIDFNPDSSEPINFIETKFMDLSAFSAHEVEVDGIVFKTVEHGYHALRIKPGKERDAIMEARSPMDAWREGQKYKNNPELLVEHYDKFAIMELLCRAKLAQHTDVREVLLATRDRELLKVYDTDYYWGTGVDGTGENKMGKLWMKLRAELIIKN